MFLISYNSGLRLQELLRIRINSFNWDKIKENNEEMGEIIVLGKGNKEGIALLPNWLMRRVGAYIRQNLNTKPKDFLLFPMSGRSWELHLKNAGIKAGITKMGENGQYIQSTKVHPHKLRHQLGHDLVKEGKHIRVIQEALRHENISSTQRYTQISKEELKEAMKSRNKPREIKQNDG
jgi:site-specific recombinase XerD